MRLTGTIGCSSVLLLSLLVVTQAWSFHGPSEIAVLYSVPLPLYLCLSWHTFQVNAICCVCLAVVALSIGIAILGKGPRAIGRVAVREVLLKAILEQQFPSLRRPLIIGTDAELIVLLIHLLIHCWPLDTLTAVGGAFPGWRVEAIDVVGLIVHRLLLHFKFDLLVDLHRIRVVRSLPGDHLIVRVLVDQLLLDLMGCGIVLVLVVAKGQSTLPDRWVLHVSLCRHQANGSLLLLLHSNVVLWHELLRVDHRQKAVQCFHFNFLRITYTILILQKSLGTQFGWITSWLRVDIILLEWVEYLLFRMIEGTCIVLLVIRWNTVH